eukprot:jgi/Hompol1/2228/HPOL_005896-RA
MSSVPASLGGPSPAIQHAALPSSSSSSAVPSQVPQPLPSTNGHASPVNRPASDFEFNSLFKIISEHTLSAYPVLGITPDLIDFASPFLLNAMTALAVRYLKSPRRGISLRKEGEAYHRQAMELLGTAINEGPSYTNIFALTLISLWCVGAAYGGKSRVLMNTAVTMAQQQGLHNEVKFPVDVSKEERQLRRSLWWILYQGDRETSFSKNIPCLISHSSPSQVPYPDVHSLSNGSLESMSPTINAQGDIQQVPPTTTRPSSYSKYMELLQILTKTFRLLMSETDLYATGQIASAHAQVEMERNTIDLDLKVWFAQLPPHLANVQPMYSALPTAEIPSTWRDAAMLVMYHGFRIELFLPPIMRSTELGLYSVVANNSSFAECVQSAMAIDKIFQVFLQHNPYFYYAPPSIYNALAPVAITLWIMGLVQYKGTDRAMLDACFERLATSAENCAMYWEVVQPGVDTPSHIMT